MATNPTEVIRRDDEAGVMVRQEFGATEIQRSAETAQQALATQYKAMVEARFVVAMRMKRNWAQVRVEINKLCDNPDFAAEALYAKPIGYTPDGWESMTKRERLVAAPANWPRGFSIRFIECALFEMGNVDNSATIIYEDDDQRLTQVVVMDLERNTGYSRTVLTKKRVERSKLRKNQESISQRINSAGNIVYLVEATADEVNLSEASGVSKAIRTMGERLLRPDLKREWRDKIETTIRNSAARDPEGEKKKLIDAFAAKGVLPNMLEAYLEHSIEQLQPAEIVILRQVWTALAAGDVTWREVMQSKTGEPEAEDTPGAKKVKDILKAKQEQKAAANPPSNEEPKQEVKAASASPESPKAETTAPAASAPVAPQPQQQASQQPPANLPNLDDFPEASEPLWVRVKGVIYMLHDNGYRAWVPEPKKGSKRGQLDFGE